MKEEIKRIKVEREGNVSELDNNVEHLEEYTRQENIIISGVEYDEDETVDALVNEVINVAKKLETEIKGTHISVIYRLPTRNVKSPPPIIVRLVNRWKEDQ